MLLVAEVRKERRCPLPPDHAAWPLEERLSVRRSDIPAVTHVDYSARVQTVSSDVNPRFYALIKAFEAQTGCGVIINTSFNVRGEPMVCSPDDACRCFLQTEIDALAIGPFLVRRATRRATYCMLGGARRESSSTSRAPSGIAGARVYVRREVQNARTCSMT
jgi:carbamoyltransferase